MIFTYIIQEAAQTDDYYILSESILIRLSSLGKSAEEGMECCPGNYSLTPFSRNPD